MRLFYQIINIHFHPDYNFIYIFNRPAYIFYLNYPNSKDDN